MALASIFDNLGNFLESWWFQVLILPFVMLLVGFTLIFFILVAMEMTRSAPHASKESRWEHQEIKQLERQLHDRFMQDDAGEDGE